MIDKHLMMCYRVRLKQNEIIVSFFFFSSFSKTNIKKKRKEFHFLKYRKTVDRTKGEKNAARTDTWVHVYVLEGEKISIRKRKQP